jgi:hypothetical protein
VDNFETSAGVVPGIKPASYNAETYEARVEAISNRDEKERKFYH